MSGELNPEQVFKEMEKDKEKRLEVIDPVEEEETEVISEKKPAKKGISLERKELAQKVLNLLQSEGVTKQEWTKVLSRAYNLAKK